MDISLVVGLLGLGLAVGFIVVTLRRGAHGRTAEVQEALDSLQGSGNILDKYLGKLAGPLTTLPPIVELGSSPMHAKLQALLLAAGRPYGGSVEVLLGAQVAAVLLGGLGFVLSMSVDMFVLRVGIILLSFAVAIWPVASTRDRARKRARKIDAELPDFVELLLIRISGGQSLRVAMRRTSELTTGPVSDEVANLLRVLDSQVIPDVQAYELSAEALGTPNGRAFCNTLAQGDLEGAKTVQALQSLASTLRVSEFQRQRKENGKLPTKLVLIMSIHLLPIMFIAVLVPTVVAFQGMQ